jgi:hypothetical protein
MIEQNKNKKRNFFLAYVIKNAYICIVIDFLTTIPKGET